MEIDFPQEHILHVVPAYQGALPYVAAARGAENGDLKPLWNHHVLDPYWHEWAADQFNEARTRQELSTPVGPEGLDELEAEARGLAASGVESLVEAAYAAITACLPSPLPEKAICIMAVDPSKRFVLENQNGVAGSCVGDNILVEIHPGGADWQRWLPFVLAHEYNHTVAGYVHFYLKGNTSATLLDSMIFEGLADSFADQLFPGLEPFWNRALTPAQEAEQWHILQPYLDSTESDDYLRFIFGREAAGTPPFTGYTIGYHIVQTYLAAHPHTPMTDLVMKSARELLIVGGYSGRPDASQSI